MEDINNDILAKITRIEKIQSQIIAIISAMNRRDTIIGDLALSRVKNIEGGQKLIEAVKDINEKILRYVNELNPAKLG